MNQVVPISESASAIAERVIINGDLSKLTAQERVNYYTEVCKSVGLNPLTKPFEYITLNGKLTLYALRACTDQLRSVYAVSVEEMTESEREGVFIVTAKVKNGQGRTDIAKGAVSISGLKGEALANAMMKAETKAKRRATLSLCGLGWLDESEVDSIPGAVRGQPNAQAAAIHNSPTMPADPMFEQDPDGQVKAWCEQQKKFLDECQATEFLRAWKKRNDAALGRLEQRNLTLHTDIMDHYVERYDNLSQSEKVS